MCRVPRGVSGTATCLGAKNFTLTVVGRVGVSRRPTLTRHPSSLDLGLYALHKTLRFLEDLYVSSHRHKVLPVYPHVRRCGKGEGEGEGVVKQGKVQTLCVQNVDTETSADVFGRVSSVPTLTDRCQARELRSPPLPRSPAFCYYLSFCSGKERHGVWEK